MTLQEAKREAVRLANETRELYSVVVQEGATCGLLGNNQQCEVVPFTQRHGRVVMGNYGPGALLNER